MSEIEKKRITPEKKTISLKNDKISVHNTGFFLNPALIIATCELRRLHNLFLVDIIFFC